MLFLLFSNVHHQHYAFFLRAKRRFKQKLAQTVQNTRWCLKSLTIWRIRWKLFPWKLKACSKRTLSSTVHSSGNGVKLARSVKALSMLCLCQKSIPNACKYYKIPLTMESFGPQKSFCMNINVFFLVIVLLAFILDTLWFKEKKGMGQNVF